MNAIRPNQLVQFDFCNRRNLIGTVERVIPDSEPRPLSKDYLREVNIGGQRTLLKRMSELRPLCDRDEPIVSTESEIG